MSSTMSACACMGPPGDCPCLRQQRGQKIHIKESHISEDVFDCLSDEDKEALNELKHKALALYFKKTWDRV